MPRKRRKWGWSWALLLALFLIGVLLLAREWHRLLVAEGEAGYQSLETAAQALKQRDLAQATQALEQAETHFSRGTDWLLGGGKLLPLLKFVPGLDTVTSGIALMEAGSHLSTGAQAFTHMLDETLQELRDRPHEVTLLDLLVRHEATLSFGSHAIERAALLLTLVKPESLPTGKQVAFRESEALLAPLAQALALSVDHIDLLEELLGGNGPRAYLFLFQNNHELRPTGGFIGSYALLDIHQGKIRRFFVDGIFNPDGQLRENIVPPAPLQKISAGWSLHDSNWFPDFPASAEQARFFYEKTGGPTTDGVVALTPVVLERILEIIGPVTLPEYGVTIDATNFLPLIQEEVEVEYDKEENNPKKILGDLTGVILERLTESPDAATLLRLADALVALLNERHILLFARDEAAQGLIDASGWSGRMLATPYDSLAVIHANINGYKTDGVIDDRVDHRASIQADGSVIDTVTVTRTHRGGRTDYEWWNKVNANYMRVYVPLGSELLSASGMTREFPEPPIDYTALGFRRSEAVENEEGKIRIDEATGTRIGEEFGKTVFGNWVYVSPGETVTVTYRYRLPWRLALSDTAAPFSILYQKQSGTEGWHLSSVIEYPEEVAPIWQSPENLVPYGRTLTLDTDLNRNVFLGLVFRPHY